MQTSALTLLLQLLRLSIASYAPFSPLRTEYLTGSNVDKKWLREYEVSATCNFRTSFGKQEYSDAGHTSFSEAIEIVTTNIWEQEPGKFTTVLNCAFTEFGWDRFYLTIIGFEDTIAQTGTAYAMNLLLKRSLHPYSLAVTRQVAGISQYKEHKFLTEIYAENIPHNEEEYDVYLVEKGYETYNKTVMPWIRRQFRTTFVPISAEQELIPPPKYFYVFDESIIPRYKKVRRTSKLKTYESELTDYCIINTYVWIKYTVRGVRLGLYSWILAIFNLTGSQIGGIIVLTCLFTTMLGCFFKFLTIGTLAMCFLRRPRRTSNFDRNDIFTVANFRI